MPNRMEEVMSKGAGKIKAATARIKGLSGVFNQLAEEHAEASTLLKLAGNTREASKQRDIWTKLRKNLLAHERAEVAEVYPTLEMYDATRDIASRHNGEAQELEMAIDGVDQAEFGTDAWHERILSLKRLVIAHAEEEETEFFPKAQQVLESEQVRELEERYLQAKRTVMSAI